MGDVGDVALLAEVDCQHVVREVDDGDESLGIRKIIENLRGLTSMTTAVRVNIAAEAPIRRVEGS